LRFGRPIRIKTIAPKVNRNHAVPPAPISRITGIESAEPSWTTNIAVTVSTHGGSASSTERDKVFRLSDKSRFGF
jgi:hypothetical protein